MSKTPASHHGSRKDRKQNQNSSQSQTQVATLQQIERSGPIPEASEIERYEAVLSGAAERLFTMAEKEQAHRHGVEESAVGIEGRDRQEGRYLGAFLATACIAAGTFVAVMANPWAGVVIASGGPGGVLLAKTLSRGKE